MASPIAIAIQCEKEINRIEARMTDLIGEGFTPLPRVYRDREILRRDQLRIIADWLDRIPESIEATLEVTEDDRLTKALELLNDSKWTKAQMESVLRGEA